MTKISVLPQDTAPTTTDYLATVDAETSTTKRITISSLLSLITTVFTNRRNNSSNTTELAAKIQTGWGAITVGTAGAVQTTAITFPVSFSAAPIVLITFGGDQASGTVALGSGNNTVQGVAGAKAYAVTVNGFTAYMWANASWSIGNIIYFHWIAIGT